jgi:hypothetical protein
MDPSGDVLVRCCIKQWEHGTLRTWAFATETGKSETQTLDTLKGICKRAGLAPKSVHALRHSCGAHSACRASASPTSTIIRRYGIGGVVILVSSWPRSLRGRAGSVASDTSEV